MPHVYWNMGSVFSMWCLEIGGICRKLEFCMREYRDRVKTNDMIILKNERQGWKKEKKKESWVENRNKD